MPEYEYVYEFDFSARNERRIAVPSGHLPRTTSGSGGRDNG